MWMSLFAFVHVYANCTCMKECRYTCVEKDSSAIDSIQKGCNPLLRESEDFLSKSILKRKKNNMSEIKK